MSSRSLLIIDKRGPTHPYFITIFFKGQNFFFVSAFGSPLLGSHSIDSIFQKWTATPSFQLSDHCFTSNDGSWICPCGYCYCSSLKKTWFISSDNICFDHGLTCMCQSWKSRLCWVEPRIWPWSLACLWPSWLNVHSLKTWHGHENDFKQGLFSSLSCCKWRSLIKYRLGYFIMCSAQTKYFD